MSHLTSIRRRRAGVVIAGGGLAAQRASETLRRDGYDGAIRVIAREPHAPYDRPPLSKEFLTGELDERALEFRPQPWYAEHDVELLLGERAGGLDAPGREVLLAGGSRLPFEQLLIATGSAPRRLPGTERYENVYELRTRDDARALREALSTRPRLVVIGSGFIGQEVAATAKRLGASVTIVEAAPIPLGAILGPQLGE
jgi:3-phenylpropionate/trans-cinnamate dioxygenase ferredoxin reductase subunit